jgi:hypothetical protein
MPFLYETACQHEIKTQCDQGAKSRSLIRELRLARLGKGILRAILALFSIIERFLHLLA